MGQLGLAVRADGTLVKNGRPYRGIGVNYFDAFLRTLSNSEDTSYEEGFKVLAEHKIPFARIAGCGFWPSEYKLYRKNKALYFQKLDAVVKSAEKHGIGLIPSLFWYTATVPDLMGEPRDQWGNPRSKTHEFMRAYTREVVTRYRGSPAIWGWEFGNEYNLDADLPNAVELRPKIIPQLGTRSSRSARDDLTHDMMRTAFVAFAKEVRKYDAHRIISTGNSFPRPSAWHQRHEKSWAADTSRQYTKMLLGDNPHPINVLSVHAYAENARIKPALQIAAGAKKPLFIGEFGVLGPPSPAAQRRFNEMLALIEKEGVPLAALWVYDREGGDEWSVTATNNRSYQLRALSAANARLRAEMSGRKVNGE